MRKRVSLILIICILMSLVTGCWDRVEISDIAIASIAALDKTDNDKTRLTLVIIIPRQFQQGGASGSPSNKKDYIQISGEGDTVMDAYEAIRKKSSRNLFLSQLKVLVIGEKLARAGIADSLDFFSRQRDSRLSKVIVFTKNLNELLNADSGLDRLLSDTIKEELAFNIHKNLSLRDFLDMLTEEGIDPMGVEVEMVNMTEGENSDTSEKSCGITGLAVFHNDKLVGWLDNKESSGIYILIGKAKDYNFSINIPEEHGGGNIGLLLRTDKSKIKATIKNNKVEFNIILKADSIIYESGSKLDLSDHKSVHYIEKLESNYIKNIAESALSKIRGEYGADIIGLGKKLYNKNPQLWIKKYDKVWKDQFGKTTINIIAEMHIPRLGLDTKSATLHERDFVKVED